MIPARSLGLRPRRSAAVLVAALALAAAVGAAAVVGEPPASLELWLDCGGGSADAPAPLLMIDWTVEGAAVGLALGCACELLPALDDDNDGGGGAGDDHGHGDIQPPSLTVRPGDARVFRLLRPSARLACSVQCGRVYVGAVDGSGGEWTLPDAGAAVRLGGGRPAPSDASSASAAVVVVGGASWSGGGGGPDESAPLGRTTLHALALRAARASMQPDPPPRELLRARLSALGLFLGLNAAAAAFSRRAS